MRVNRYIEDIAFSEKYSRQMRFIAGPRQSGKTTIAKEKLKSSNNLNFYYNWDRREIRDRYRKETDFLAKDLLENSNKKHKQWVCFDEIHKFPKWKNILKDIFDTYEKKLNIIVTGSARLDMFKKVGDSLAGRYFLFKLNPLILCEILNKNIKTILPLDNSLDYIENSISGKKYEQEMMNKLIDFSGFPEPLLKNDKIFSKKWHNEYLERIIKEDLRDLSSIHQLEKVIELGYLLPSKIASPLSINSLREDLELNFNTIKNYIKYLMLTYSIFEIPPYQKKNSRLVKKEKKVYFYDWTHVNGDAEKFENYVALELKSRVDLWNDTLADEYKMFFLRTRDGKETDFIITRNFIPYILFEAKLSSQSIDRHHYVHSAMFNNIPFVQLVKDKDVLKVEQKRFFVVSASRYFS